MDNNKSLASCNDLAVVDVNIGNMHIFSHGGYNNAIKVVVDKMELIDCYINQHIDYNITNMDHNDVMDSQYILALNDYLNDKITITQKGKVITALALYEGLKSSHSHYLYAREHSYTRYVLGVSEFILAQGMTAHTQEHRQDDASIYIMARYTQHKESMCVYCYCPVTTYDNKRVCDRCREVHKSTTHKSTI